MAPSIPNLVDAWFGKPNPNAEDPSLHDHFAAADCLSELIREEPLTAWEFILEANKRPFSEKRRSMLAAGPLEDLLSEHGELLIEKAEHEARNDPRFKALLRGVWQHGMNSFVWARVQQARK